MTAIGSASWAERTGGRLGNRDVLAFLASGIRVQAASIPAQAAAALGLRRPLAVDLEEIPIPDSAAAREASEICASLPDFVAAHSHRTYLWGMMLAEIDKSSPDPELAWVASLTHDAGLEPAVRNQDQTCFTLRSAAAAREVGANAGWPEERIRRVADAVTMHFNMRVPESEPPEVRLVNAGAGLDVAAQRRWQLHPDTVAAVVARYPRDGFADGFVDLLDAHTRCAPRSRCGVICRYGAFKSIVRRSSR